jgi:peptide/nickel transport system permease protein
VSGLEPAGASGAPDLDTIRADPTTSSGPVEYVSGRRRLRRFAAHPGGVLALAWLAILVIVAVFAPLIAPHSPTAQDLTHPWAAPSATHWLGTDDLGRDVLSRLIYGARVSMRVSFEVVALALIVALPVGLAAGYRGGQVDNVLMRFMDGGLSFPPLVLALAIAGVLGPGINNVALALAVVFFPSFSRLIRGQSLAVKEETFVEASQTVGTPPVPIVVRRVLPNVSSALIVAVALALGAALLAEAGLSFLGLGTQPPAASWGSMLREYYDNGLFTHPWSLVVPGMAIALAVLAFNTVGDAMAATLGVTRTHLSRRVQRTPRGGASRGLTVVARPAQPSSPAPVCGATVAIPGGTGSPLLEVDALSVELQTETGLLRAVDEVSITVGKGEVLGLVGESGSGKTLTALAIMRLLASPPATIVGGAVRFAGRDLLSLDIDHMRRLRGGQIAMVFQDPMSTLNPAIRIGKQIAEAIRLHQDVDRTSAARRAVELLEKVGIPDPAQRVHSYPHELSGGMCQRAVIAMALSCQPQLLIADEPTTALDVTIQAQVVDLLRQLQRDTGMGVIFVTHDLGLVADLCDRVAVMYAGQIIETAPTDGLFAHPVHPYTEGLLAATPSTEEARAGELRTISGQVPVLTRMPSGCRFHPRCPYSVDACFNTRPPLVAKGDRSDRCLRARDLTLRGVQ